jgi:hypothetical protein
LSIPGVAGFDNSNSHTTPYSILKLTLFTK